MRHSINHGLEQATLDFVLDEDDEINSELDSLVAMSPDVEVITRVPSKNAAQWWGSSRGLMSGEMPIAACFRSREDGAFLSLAPRLPGNIIQLTTTDETSFHIMQGSYLASTSDISITYRFVSFQGTISKNGIFLAQTAGEGDVFCGSFGAMVERVLEDEESFVVDTRFLVAFDESLSYQPVRLTRDPVGGAPMGIGLAIEFSGPGKIIYQTRPSR